MLTDNPYPVHQNKIQHIRGTWRYASITDYIDSVVFVKKDRGGYMNRITIPAKLKVGGRVYKINKDYRFNETRLWGQADHSLCEIRISARDEGGRMRDRQTIEETFLHELVHCIGAVYCSGVEITEGQATGIAKGIYQVLRDNSIFK